MNSNFCLYMRLRVLIYCQYWIGGPNTEYSAQSIMRLSVSQP